MRALPPEWRRGEIAVIGLAKSGSSAAMLLARAGARVYASDAASHEEVERAAAFVRAAGADADVGRHDLGRIGRASLVVTSPGVPPDAPPLVAARDARVAIVSEVEVGLRFLAGTRVIAVTGTNGKTTTTALVGHLLRALGRDAVDAGNIGTPVCEIALRPRHPDWLALEMSSFQLHDTPGLRPNVGVVTNLSPDHLDRYSDVDDYYADKALIFRNATRDSTWVLNADDAGVMRLAVRLPGGQVSKSGAPPGSVRTFSLSSDTADAYLDRSRAVLSVCGRPVIQRDDVHLFGDHNVANALAATLAVTVADPAYATPEARALLAGGLRAFRAIAHRLEIVGEYGGVLWINDSKATNVSSTRVAIEGMTRPTILLLGGRHKGEPYTALADPIARIVKRVLAFGEARPEIEKDLAGRAPLELLDAPFPEVIGRARAVAEPGDVVLLAPACSSFDMFRNYVERGTEFRRLASGVRTA
ncbi:MAG: UDP-N-acetylmuramoyl-L-alanine--D-glutamate ligase [Gemmatimonadaceae bacterium]